MPYWMVGEHGTHVCYDMGDVERHKASGWKLLNQGESPDYSLLDKPAEHAAAQESAIATGDDAAVPADADILDGSVVKIQPQLSALSRLEIEQLRAREIAGRNRKGLLCILADEIEARG